MWFASIWIFTLRLPWQLGADFFMRYLLDGDPAPNTLSRRRVAGLQTVGKTYLARASNITKYTDGRFHPTGLASEAIPLSEATEHPRLLPVREIQYEKPAPSLLVLHDEDANLGPLTTQFNNILGAVRISSVAGVTPFEMSPNVVEFVRDLMTDQDSLWSDRFGAITPVATVDAIIQEASKIDAVQIISPHAAVGPTKEILQKLQQTAASRDIAVVGHLNAYDLMCWPNATHGFFRFKEYIPEFVKAL